MRKRNHRTIENILGRAPMPGLASREPASTQETLFFIVADEPTTFDEAQQQCCWRKTMLEEMESIYNCTWELTDLPIRHHPIGLKWVFKIKCDASGYIVKHKARLVANGYVQK